MLDKHWDGGFLAVGWHSIEVTEADTFNYNTGNPGVKFMLLSDTGANGKVSFPLADAALWKLASFVRALGLTREQAAGYNETRIDHHRRMVGRKAKVRVASVRNYNDPSKSYNEVVEWIPASEPTPLDAPPPEHDAPAEELPNDDIPF